MTTIKISIIRSVQKAEEMQLQAEKKGVRKALKQERMHFFAIK